MNSGTITNASQSPGAAAPQSDSTPDSSLDCPCCRGTRGADVAMRPLHKISRFSEPFDIVVCPACGFQRRASFPADLAALYTEDYYTGKAEYAYRDERDQGRFDAHVHRARLRTIARRVAPPADFLDVGCAFGGLVEEAARFGYQARGLDISSYAVGRGRERGLDVRLGTLEKNDLQSQSVDVLTMIEVIEHLPDPAAVFAELRRLVRPGGLVVIQTANMLGRQATRGGADYHYYLPGHLCYYDTRTLRAFLLANGFEKPRFFRPTDFGLLAKLKKSRGDFKKPADYLRWGRIAYYHWKSLIALGDFALTSSMVCYARRANES